jgi:hypothetical protein
LVLVPEAKVGLNPLRYVLSENLFNNTLKIVDKIRAIWAPNFIGTIRETLLILFCEYRRTELIEIEFGGVNSFWKEETGLTELGKYDAG